MTTTEAEWDTEARGWAGALSYYEASLCPACGQPAQVCQSPANEEAFYVPLPVRCHARTALSAKQAKHGSDGDVTAPDALLWTVGLRADMAAEVAAERRAKRQADEVGDG